MCATLAAELRPDVIHVHNLYPMLSPAVLRTTAAPVVMTLHNYRLMCLPATFLRDGRTCEDCLGRGPWRGVVHRCYRGSAAGSASLATALALHRRAGHVPARHPLPGRERVRAHEAHRGGHRARPDRASSPTSSIRCRAGGDRGSTSCSWAGSRPRRASGRSSRPGARSRPASWSSATARSGPGWPPMRRKRSSSMTRSRAIRWGSISPGRGRLWCRRSGTRARPAPSPRRTRRACR